MPFIVGKVVAIAATAAISVTHGISEHGEVESITPLMQEYVVPLIEEDCFTVINKNWAEETRCEQKKVLILQSKVIGRSITYIKDGHRTTVEELL
jgi:hypothetical protein|tara:strand:+ start:132 stop:416 length:285 start_codon:yes stop_codon:yes gene_type:complete